MDSSHTYITAQELNDRDRKHKQIMTAIYSFKRSLEEMKILDQVKQTTKMEIDLRHRNCTHNQIYRFPLLSETPEEDCSDIDLILESRTVLYDLHTQAEVIRKSVSTKTISLEASRRVKSLEKEHFEDRNQIIGKIKRKPLPIGKSPQKLDYLNRKNSLRDHRLQDRSNFKLPELRKVPSEKKNIMDNLEMIVGRKMQTEASSPNNKRLAKYMKEVGKSAKSSIKVEKTRKFFLAEY